MSRHPAVEALLRIVPADHGADEQLDWSTVEGTLGAKLPSDYKSFMATYGGGDIGELVVLLPLPVDYPQWDPGSISEHSETLRGIWDDEGGVPGVSLGADAVLAWGTGCNANEMGWLMAGADPDHWPVVVWRRHGQPRWAMFDCGMVEFVRRMMLAEFDECPLSDKSLWGRVEPFVNWREQQHRYLAGLDPMTGEPDPVIQGFLEWPKP
jgi:hypothetical protein